MKRFEMILAEDEESKISLDATNDGFSALEILGFLSWRYADIIKQIEGEIEPDIVKRTVIVDEED